MSNRVLLLLEGTYPYVRGGVSGWVHQIIRGLPELEFELLFIGGQRVHYGDMAYELPDNVSGITRYYLEDAWKARKGRPKRGPTAAFERAEKLHECFKNGGEQSEDLQRLLEMVVGRKPRLTQDNFLYSRASWDQLVRKYEQHCTDPSFLNYFWTVRAMHAPIFQLARIASSIKRVGVVHSVSTGYAGLLGALLKANNPDTNFFLTEHGIYTKERKIDLSQASWIEEPTGNFEAGLTDDVGYLRKLWISFYHQIGHIAYAAADPIVSLYEGNRTRQITDGALPERTKVIPNGISLAPLAEAMDQRSEKRSKVLGFIGRVVPIKDVKTFIRAMRSVCVTYPDAEGWIIGPTEEDEDYARECENLVESLGLSDSVKFLGFQKIVDILPQLDLMVLTSISEAQPLVILEGYAAGVPCVATDVGSCRELIEGGTEADRALGISGGVTGIADPEATAEACIRFLRDDDLWYAAQKAGLARVRTYYSDELMFERYRSLYREAGAWQE